MIRPFIRAELTPWLNFIAVICHFSWLYCPLFAVYALVAACVFFYQKEFRWGAYAFVAFGMLLQQALFVAMWWIGGAKIAT